MSDTISLKTLSGVDEHVQTLEYEIYLEAGYIAPNPHRRVLENDCYPDHQVVVAFSGDKAVGSVRVVINSGANKHLFNLPCFEAFQIWPWADSLLREVDTDRLMQIGTMVIRPEFRGGTVRQALIQRLTEIFVEAGTRFAMATIDEHFYKNLRTRNIPLVPMGDTLFYMGSSTVPVMVAREWILYGTIPDAINEQIRTSMETVALKPAICGV
ncbi:MAG: hypothetical protein GX117_07185 [Candidatus Hydrogenedentes bacterium]|nr:hypothetical protein [Candidatus Hydrogenedentota bacterium]